MTQRTPRLDFTAVANITVSGLQREILCDVYRSELHHLTDITADSSLSPPDNHPRDVWVVSRVSCYVDVLSEFRFADAQVERFDHEAWTAAARKLQGF